VNAALAREREALAASPEGRLRDQRERPLLVRASEEPIALDFGASGRRNEQPVHIGEPDR